MELAKSNDDRRRAAALLGRAVVRTGDAARADSLLSFALAGDLAEESRLEARVARAEARRRLGRLQDADADYVEAIRLRPDEPRLRLERFHLLLQAGRADDAAAEFLALVRRPQRVAVEEQILAAADSFARRAPQAARVALAGAASTPLRGSTQASLITRRGELWRAAGELDSARAEFQRATAIAPGTNGSVAGKVALARLDLAQADSVSDLERVKDVVERAGLGGLGAEVVEARLLARRVQRCLEIAKLGDVAWLTAAEVARDSLDAPYLSRALFLRFADELPTSVWAPKAILAALAVGPYPYGAPGPPSDEELRRRLRAEYASNPYVAAVDGSANAEAEGGENAGMSFASAERALDVRLQVFLGRIGIQPGLGTPAVSDTTEELRRGTPPVN